MHVFDESSALCQIFTYKEGLLAVFAYDLRINVTSFVIEVGGEKHFIKADFDALSLHVDCAMVDGSERPGLLSEKDKKDIDKSIIYEVLDTKRYKNIILVSSSVKKEDSTYDVKGLLTLHGITREIFFPVKTGGNHYSADVWLRLTDFGIKPFSALFGTMKIKPDILIHVMMPKLNDYLS
jgi:hypothetical protein